MKLKSNIEIASGRVTNLHHKKAIVCEMKKSTQATRSNLPSKQDSIACDEDTFSILSNLESYLQKDIERFHIIAKSFDNLDKEATKSIRGKKKL